MIKARQAPEGAGGVSFEAGIVDSEPTAGIVIFPDHSSQQNHRRDYLRIVRACRSDADSLLIHLHRVRLAAWLERQS